MAGGTEALKGQMKLISLDEIEDGLDDMAELLEEANEIQEVRCALAFRDRVCAITCEPVWWVTHAWWAIHACGVVD